MLLNARSCIFLVKHSPWAKMCQNSVFGCRLGAKYYKNLAIRAPVHWCFNGGTFLKCSLLPHLSTCLMPALPWPGRCRNSGNEQRWMSQILLHPAFGITVKLRTAEGRWELYVVLLEETIGWGRKHSFGQIIPAPPLLALYSDSIFLC